MSKTIRIDNRDLVYSIDTYNMFTAESFFDNEAQHYTDEYELTPDEIELIDFDFNHVDAVHDFANGSINLLEQNLVQHGTGIVENIELESSDSPQFYNYTTDSYRADWTVNTKKLEEYIKENQAEYTKFEAEEWDGRIGDNDDAIVAKLDFYTRTEYPEDDYNSSMWEIEFNVWAENSKPVPEFEELLEKKRKVKQ